ncbi:MAG: alpha-glucosidase [Clostridiaceae bacterium]
MKEQWWQKEVIYQIYPKSFYDSNGDGIGDIKGINKKLEYLSELGVTMLWICPIYKSPMDDNGYDISDYFDLAPEFGTMEELEELIENAKGYGIKIILDLVINHTSDEHQWFKEAINDSNSKYRDYYIFKKGKEVPNNWRSIFGGSVWEKVEGRDEYYFHVFSKKQPDLNWENEELRKTLYKMVNYWLEKGIAGFRIDAITFIKKDLTFKSLEADGVDGLVKCTKTSRNQPGIELFLHELKRETFSKYNCVTVAEAPGVPYEELDDFIGEDGYFSMIFDFKYADLDIASGSEWFKRVPWTVTDLREKVMTSQMHIQKYGWGANFIENHDQPRATSKYLLENENNIDAVKMLGAMYFLLRGTPFIYQGQELGMTNFKRKSIDEFNDISSIDQYHRSIQEGFTEEEALKIVNIRSRDNSRTPFPWNDKEYGGFSTVKPWIGMTNNYKAINAAAQVGKKDSVFEFYKIMIDFRQNSIYSECLIYGDISPIDTNNYEVIAYTRQKNNETIYCYFNFSKNEVFELLDIRDKKVIFNNLKDADIREDGIMLKANQALLITIKN